ncbi:STAS-like domain-containing protein [Pantoea sp. C8B4]|uniref:STAS-like domain-containing protein n=1 Tax=Pantoea sp. C8B4 TaxID=3243083 RepID=UPI003EDB253F
MTKILISKDFSKTPFGRYPSDGPNSAERFRKECLVPAFINATSPVEVDFDGIALAIGSSFLEEAFGGMVRKEGIDKDKLRKLLIVKSEMPFYKQQISRFIDKAEPEKVI